MMKRIFLLLSIYIFASTAFASDIKVWFSNPTGSASPSPLSYDPSKRIDEALYDFIDSATPGTTIYVAVFEMNLDGRQNLKDIKGLLNKKHNEGVKVYVIGHSTKTLEGLNFPTTTYRDIYIDEGAQEGTTRGLMHNKFVVLKDSAVWTGSYNFTVSATIEQDNNAVQIYSPALARIFEREFLNMYGTKESPGKKFGDLKVSTATTLQTNVSGSSVTLSDGTLITVYFNPYTSPKTLANAIEDELMGNARDGIQPPQESIYFSLAWFSRESIVDAIKESMNTNSKLEIAGILDDQSSNMPVYYKMKQSSISVTLDSRRSSFGVGLMHHKFGIVDAARKNARVIIGSANWSDSGTTSDGNDNDENIVIIYNPDISRIYYKEFLRLHKLTNFAPTFSYRKAIDNLICYPSPAVSKTTIGYNTSNNVRTIRIKIYNLSGELVRELKQEPLYSGFYNETEWNLENSKGEKVAPGLYFVKVEAETPDGTFFAFKKMAVTK